MTNRLDRHAKEFQILMNYRCTEEYLKGLTNEELDKLYFEKVRD